jgi:hypothetical protein
VSTPDQSGLRTLAANVASAAPTSWAAMKAGASVGAMPAKVLDNERAIVTAGLANDVEAVLLLVTW